MNTKKIVLLAGLTGTFLIVFLFSLETNSCYSSTFCMGIRRFFNKDIFQLIFLTPVLLLLSLITYKMRDEVFRAWWRFARWWAPVIIAVTLLLERAGSGGGIGIGGAVSAAFDILILGVLYAVFVIVSLIQIARAYFRAK